VPKKINLENNRMPIENANQGFALVFGIKIYRKYRQKNMITYFICSNIVSQGVHQR
jgi:hypothetical protein